MKMLNNRGKVSIFEDELEIDKDLPKYRKVIAEDNEDKKNKNTISSKESSGGNRFNIDSFDPDSLIEEFYNDIYSEDAKTATSRVISYTEEKLRSFIGNSNSDNFNIFLKKELKRRIKSSTRMFLSTNSVVSGESRKRNLFSNAWNKLVGMFSRIDTKRYPLDILSLFSEIKLVSGKEKLFIDRIREYVQLLEKARKMGQRAQEEQLVDNIIIHIYESVLYSSGANKYITVDDLARLQEKCKKQLDLDYIKNFNRIIPDDIAKKKMMMDSLGVFDNYLILHYNPSGINYKETKKEIKAKKDPILFGIIRGSNKLYYIGSWEDEYCDLTWDEVVDKIGERVL